MDVLYVYCFKSVGSYQHKLSKNIILSDSLLGNKLYLFHVYMLIFDFNSPVRGQGC